MKVFKQAYHYHQTYPCRATSLLILEAEGSHVVVAIVEERVSRLTKRKGWIQEMFQSGTKNSRTASPAGRAPLPPQKESLRNNTHYSLLSIKHFHLYIMSRE